MQDRVHLSKAAVDKGIYSFEDVDSGIDPFQRKSRFEDFWREADEEDLGAFLYL